MKIIVPTIIKMKKKILVAPLNWGLGHATRCIPIIKALKDYNYEPIIASDGTTLSLLKKEFPGHTTLELPSYGISYSSRKAFFKLKLVSNIPKILNAIRTEQLVVNKIIQDYDIEGIVSDNRLGIYSRQVPSCYITHQLFVYSGLMSHITTKLHTNYIKKFDACWVPDYVGDLNLSGQLGHPKKSCNKTIYLGPLSRLNKIDLPKKYNLLVLLSGPEPQRSKLENLLIEKLESFQGDVVFVRGIIEDQQHIEIKNHITIFNYMTTDLLEKTINQSNMVLARPGYTTIMDLAKLEKKAFFIPTPGQSEQEYLARMLKFKKIAPFCRQNDFEIEKLKEIDHYNGLVSDGSHFNFQALFSSFF